MNWTCPNCLRDQTITDAKKYSHHQHVNISAQAEGSLGVTILAYGCSNKDCKKTAITVIVGEDKYFSAADGYRLTGDKSLFVRRILPEGQARPLPAYIPEAIREDYTEACLIRDLSPKASATLARRCLQGMIRDFCKISKKRLIDEIAELERQVDEGLADRSISIESITAIDAVRKVGNIGAHMEAEVDHIVPVDAAEVQLLLELLETLFDDWYVERNKRQARLKAIADLADEKEKLVAAGKNRALQQLAPPSPAKGT